MDLNNLENRMADDRLWDDEQGLRRPFQERECEEEDELFEIYKPMQVYSDKKPDSEAAQKSNKN
jgi:hypothetical protein